MTISLDASMALVDILIKSDVETLRHIITNGLDSLPAARKHHLREQLGNELQRTGFDSEWEPNLRGRSIEEIISRLLTD